MILNTLSLVIGVVVGILAIPAFIPVISLLNWLLVPVGLIGIGLGALSNRTSGRNLCIITTAICAMRLWIGGGIL